MQKRTFKVIRELSLTEFKDCLLKRPITRTKHSFDRVNREDLSSPIEKVSLIDKGHRNGPEIHILTSSATISILNAKTMRFITS